MQIHAHPPHFGVVTSTGFGAALGASATYGLTRAIESLGGESHDPYLRHSSTLIGALAGTSWAFDHAMFKKINFRRAEFLNKYADKPVLQDGISQTIGNFQYARSNLEKGLNTLNTFSLFGWIISSFSDNQKLSTFLMGTTLLSWAGAVGTHMFGLNAAAREDQAQLNHAEKLMLERAAGCAEPEHKSVG